MNKNHIISMISLFLAVVSFLLFGIQLVLKNSVLATIFFLFSLFITYFSGYKMSEAEHEDEENGYY